MDKIFLLDESDDNGGEHFVRRKILSDENFVRRSLVR